MAIISAGSVMHGARGKAGGLLFRQFNGKTVVSVYEAPRGERSKLQLMFNDKMREASRHARVALRDPVVRAHYEKKKRRLNVTSAYTAACTDFLRHGKIEKVDTSKYGKGIITVKAFKADLGFEEVTVRLTDAAKGEVVMGKALAQEQGNWVFRSSGPLPPLEEVTISVEARDKIGNVTRSVFAPGKKEVVFHDWIGAPHLRNSEEANAGGK